MGFYTGITEATFGSGSNNWEMNHYETSFQGAVSGSESTGSVVSGSSTIYELVAVNQGSTTVYAQLFDLTGGPGLGYNPIVSIPVSASSKQTFSWRTGRSMALGIQLGWSANYSQFSGSTAAGAFYVDFRRG